MTCELLMETVKPILHLLFFNYLLIKYYQSMALLIFSGYGWNISHFLKITQDFIWCIVKNKQIFLKIYFIMWILKKSILHEKLTDIWYVFSFYSFYFMFFCLYVTVLYNFHSKDPLFDNLIFFNRLKWP